MLLLCASPLATVPSSCGPLMTLRDELNDSWSEEEYRTGSTPHTTHHTVTTVTVVLVSKYPVVIMVLV